MGFRLVVPSLAFIKKGTFPFLIFPYLLVNNNILREVQGKTLDRMISLLFTGNTMLWKWTLLCQVGLWRTQLTIEVVPSLLLVRMVVPGSKSVENPCYRVFSSMQSYNKAFIQSITAISLLLLLYRVFWSILCKVTVTITL